MAVRKKIKALPPKRVVEKFRKLKGERGNWETHWQEVADHVLPRKATFTRTLADGAKRQYFLLENVGMHSNELLSGALHGLLTNPHAIWFELTTGTPQLDSQDGVRQWLQDTGRLMHNVLNNSNFQMEVHELYTDLTAFGTSPMFIQEHERDVVRFNTRFLGECCIEENAAGFVDQLYRQWEWGAVQICQEFGMENLPKKVLEAYKKGDECKFTVVHAVYPMELVEKGDYRKVNKFISQYVLVEEEFDLRVETFAEFPYVVPRWSKAAGEKYGRSPGMNALPELKVLNKMNETMLIGAQKLVDPPLQMEDDGVVLPIITRPGGLNYRRPNTAEIKPIFNDTRIDFGYQAMEDRRKRVRDVYYVDQLQLQQGGPTMTATEVLQRTEEKMRLLGPMLGRMQSEFLRPMIDRVFNIMWSRRMIPAPPPELQGTKLDVRYSSLIAKTQRLDEGQAIMRTIQAVAPFIEMDPAVAQNFKGDQAVRTLAGIFGFPQDIIRPMREVTQMREAQAQAEAEAQQKLQEQADMQQMEAATKTMVAAGG